MLSFFFEKQKKRVSARAQLSMPDILFATLLFFFVLAGLYLYANNLQSSIEKTGERRQLDSYATNVAEYLVKNPGIPYNWETIGDLNRVELIGLAQKDRVIDTEKLVAFLNYGILNYEETRSRLGIPYYDYYVEFSGAGVTIGTGLIPPANKPVSVVQRVASLDGIPTTMTVMIYEP